MKRFDTHLGANIDPAYLCSLSDAALAQEIRESGEWDSDLLRDLIWRADTSENRLGERWDTICENGGSWEPIAAEAAKTLGVDIGI